MLNGNVPSTVNRLFSHVRTKRALVYSSRHMGTDMRIKIASIDSAVRAMGTQ